MKSIDIALEYLKNFDQEELYATVESVGIQSYGEVFVALLKPEYEDAPVGLPLFIIVNNGEARVATVEETDLLM